MNKTILGVIVVIVVVVGAVFFMNQKADAPTSENNQQTPTPSPTPTPVPNPTPGPSDAPVPTPTPTPTSTAPKTYDISATDAGYTPATLTIKKGDTVKFTNNGTKLNWPASAPHPTHTDYPEFDPKKGIAVGSSWSFTFTKTGTWRFHDHLNPTHFGSITVTE
jgi:plastocyanin